MAEKRKSQRGLGEQAGKSARQTQSESEPGGAMVIRPDKLVQQWKLSLEILKVSNRPGGLKKVVSHILSLIRDFSGCEAVGLRLKDGDDYPYYEARGFAGGFIEMENYLCARNETGEVMRDSAGSPIIECMCGNVIQGRFNPELSFFSRGGSFWSNSTTELLASTTESDRQARTRNRCNGEGYESVALIPIRGEAGNIGLLQLNDRKRDRFTEELIEFYEDIALSIAVVLSHKQTEEQLLRANERLTLAQKSAGAGMWDWDIPTGRLDWSLELYKLFGLDSTLVPSFDTWRAALHPEDRQTAEERINQSIRDRVPLSNEYRVVLPTGEVRWINALGSAIYDDSGEARRMAGICIDITERKRTEQALEEKGGMLISLLNAITESAFLMEASGTVLAANAEIEKRLGLSPGEMAGKDALSLLPADVAERRHAMIQKVIDTGKPVSFEDEREGRLTLSSIYPVLDSEGGVSRLAVFGMDITGHRKAELSLMEQERTMRTLVSNLPGFIYRCANDREWTMTFISDGCLPITGFAPDDFIGNKNIAYNDIVHPDYQEMLWARWQEVLKKRDVFEEEYPIITKSGETRWVWERGRGIFSDDGSLLYLEGFITEITARKRIEEDLERETTLLSSIMEHTGAMLVFLDNDFNFIKVNRAYAATCGYSPAEMIGKNHFDLYPGEENALIFKRVRDTGKAEQYFDKPFEFPDQPGRGVTYWDWTLVPVNDIRGGVRGLIFSLIETTAKKRLEEERQKTARLESVGTLAGGIAHDFNNILTAILGNISLARAFTGPGEELHESLIEAEKASLRAKSLTQQLLTFSKGGAPVKSEVPIAELIRDTASFALRGTNVKSNLSIPPDLWLASVDPGQISQVISNLVINAAQAMPIGGSIDILAENLPVNSSHNEVAIQALPEGDYIRIRFKDHGVGIPPEHLDRIFDPYFTTKQTGSGLGLATAYSIIQKHNGHIAVESSPGQGSTFDVYLPANRHKTTEAPESAERLAPVKGRVLVMDDEPAVRNIARQMLKHLGFSDNSLARDGEEALDLYREAMQTGNPYDVVILDLTVPGGLGGKDTIDKLRAIDPGVRAIVSSGYTDTAVMAGYLQYGFKGMIAKPYTLEELNKALHEALTGH